MLIQGRNWRFLGDYSSQRSVYFLLVDSIHFFEISQKPSMTKEFTLIFLINLSWKSIPFTARHFQCKTKFFHEFVQEINFFAIHSNGL